MQPLAGLRVIDFTTLLPGPLATLYLAEAGATVLKIERPEGEPGRANMPRRSGESIQFALLNRGKNSLVADLKDAAQLERIRSLVAEADILVEQFRPGVMKRLGLDFESLRKSNPGLIYCSITGFGQTGPLALRVGHDLTYLARAGILPLTAGSDGMPTLPAGQIADVGGGSLPAVNSILLALLRRGRDGQGAHLDISMTENVFAWMPRTLAPVIIGELPPTPGKGRHTGGSPRYGIHRSKDGLAFAIAPLEEKFWQLFCQTIELPTELRAADAALDVVFAAIQDRFGSRTAAEWEAKFDGKDVCVERIRNAAEAIRDPHFAERETFGHLVTLADQTTILALPMPFPKEFRSISAQTSPALGETKLDHEKPWGRSDRWTAGPGTVEERI